MIVVMFKIGSDEVVIVGHGDTVMGAQVCLGCLQ